MKLRCTHNSIRIRVKKSDLIQLNKEGIIQESIGLGPDHIFIFSVKKTKDKSEIFAQLETNHIIIEIPEHLAHQWINSDLVGLETEQIVSETDKLHLLIEKDFPCKDRIDEDKNDTFWELADDDPKAC